MKPRIGEVCGAKLVDTENVTMSPDDCKLCQEIKVKQRRLQKERDNIKRWSREGARFSGLIEKAQRDARELEATIALLTSRRPSIRADMTAPRGGSVPMSAPMSGSLGADPYSARTYGSLNYAGPTNG
ncbi:hypothetical protein LTR84_009537 [Exophiala bonariae]|uniref:BZIP domain-containing protein n=1 Tax=Exophiala bonariae TaxID=1690606 RepID=A0AAV9MU80_9EURO|nr:hypothetical protein LTR84_009537 [Exophiala bonariae]